MTRTSPTQIEINLENLRHNFTQLKKKAPPKAKHLCVLKSNAYGHGAPRLGRVLQEEGADYFGVGTVDEAIALREAGVKKPILLLLGILGDDQTLLLRYQITPVIFDLSIAAELNHFFEKRKKKHPIHVKIDTGMTRLGVLPKEIESWSRELSTYKYLQLEGLMTHFSDATHEAFRSKQEKVFFQSVDIIKKHFKDIPYLHLANSAAGLLGDIGILEKALIRWGIALYGAYPHPSLKDAVDLKPVMTLKSQVISIKRVPAKTPVSYGRTFTTKRESIIGVVPVGYADGYLRALSNQSSVIIHGKYAPQVGTICMDMMMVDLTEVREAKVGDEVILMGGIGEEIIRAEDLAGKAGTISYELFVRLSERISRKYLEK